MNGTLDEAITKATHSAGFLEADLLAAYQETCRIVRPEGRAMTDNALQMVLADLLDQARALQAKLQSLSV